MLEMSSLRPVFFAINEQFATSFSGNEQFATFFSRKEQFATSFFSGTEQFALGLSATAKDFLPYLLRMPQALITDQCFSRK